MKGDPKYNIVSMRVTDSECAALIRVQRRLKAKSLSDAVRHIVFEGGSLNETQRIAEDRAA